MTRNLTAGRVSGTHSNLVAQWTIYALFTGTGVGIALPGALLPFLLIHWSMSDGLAGVLFFLIFLGTTAGALLAHGKLNTSIARGCLCVMAGTAVLPFASQMLALAAFFVYGTGLGLVMTSVSLVQSRCYPETRTTEMARLNLVWSLGALLGPVIALGGAARLGPQIVLYGVAVFFAAGGALALLFVPHALATAIPETTEKFAAHSVSFLLLILVPLATGVESSAGGWLATYSKRAGETLGFTIGAATCFWAGMLISRFLQSHRRVAENSAHAILSISPGLISIALALIIVSGGQHAMLAGALALGLGVGPMYPLLLSKVLHYGERGNTVFVLAGCGASFLPMLAGFVSGQAHSLRTGLAVPFVCAVAMTCFGWMVLQREKNRG